MMKKETKKDALEVPLVPDEETTVEKPIEDIKKEVAAVVAEAVAPEEVARVKPEERRTFDIESWKPKTALGMKVKQGEVTDIYEVLTSGAKILEAGIVDALIPNIENDLLLVGQSKGKFGGGKRRVFRQTQKKTKEGNKPKFATFAVVGNQKGILGMGYGKAKETVPAREKAMRNAKLNLIRVRAGCGSWQCGCKTAHSLPFAVTGKCGSVEIKLIPAPKGTGLAVEGECKKLLKMAGIKDIWSRTSGKTETRINLMIACFEALKKTYTTKVQPGTMEALGIVEDVAHV